MSVYSTEFLVDRLYDEISKADSDSKNRLSLARPEVTTVNKKTVVNNFREMCKKMSRDEIEVQMFFSEELLKKTSIDSKGGLVIWGLFRQKGIEKITRRYINQFILCKECGASQTKLEKQDRILYMECSKCHSKKAI